MKRILALSPAAFGVVFGLFLLMTSLIHQKAPATPVDNFAFPIGISFKEIIIKDPVPPKKKPEFKEERKLIVIVDTETSVTIDVDDEKVTDPPKIGGESPDFIKDNINARDSIFQNNDADVRPVVTIEPQYPERAKYNNQEGWVKLKFDVNSSGRVENVKVMAAKPKGVFERSARKALFKWKYKPSIIQGKAVASIGHEVMLEFNLEKD